MNFVKTKDAYIGQEVYDYDIVDDCYYPMKVLSVNSNGTIKAEEYKSSPLIIRLMNDLPIRELNEWYVTINETNI